MNKSQLTHGTRDKPKLTEAGSGGETSQVTTRD
jgi:hypothetical protein